jgi:hypothetical protein
VSCLIIRGSFFCPSSVGWLSDYLKIPLTNMIMGTVTTYSSIHCVFISLVCCIGVPGLNFPFQIAELSGVRIGVPKTDAAMREAACRKLEAVLSQKQHESSPV